MSSRIHIGTSGWHYPHWKGPFYPKDIASQDMFAFYAKRFKIAEINYSFYQLPKAQTVEAWRENAPADFLFAVKVNRYITHMKKLKDPQEPLGNFLDRIQLLGGRLGPLLFQLPPNWRCNCQRLKDFISVLPQEFRCAFEFRDPSWFNDEVYQILEDAGAALCIYDIEGRLSPKIATADFTYIRLHGPGRAYQGSYSSKTLAAWAEDLLSWLRQGKYVFCFFDNDQNGFAPANAMSLQDMLALMLHKNMPR